MNVLVNQKFIKVLKIAAFTASVLLGIFVTFKLVVYLAPFVIALLISSLIEPIVKLLTVRLRLPRKIASAVTLLFVLSTFGFIIVLIISKLIEEIISITNYLSSINITDSINSLANRIEDIYLWLPQEVTSNLSDLLSKLIDALVKFLNPIVKGAFITAFSIPEAMIFILVTILSTYFITSDREIIWKFIQNQVPYIWIERVRNIKNDLFSALFGYLKAQLILMSITFTELSIGFSVIKIKYALLLALLISFIDALPVLGTGGVLVPWALYSFITGDVRMGISILVIYGVVIIVRPMVEPKILSQQIGVHPLLTIFGMYTGLQLFGILGMILGPITILMLKNILSGTLKNKTIKEFLEKSKI